MSITALIHTRPFYPAAGAITVPLSERFPGKNVAYLSAGAGGFLSGVAKITPHGPSIVDRSIQSATQQPAQPVAAAQGARLKKLTGGFGLAPVILSTSANLEWILKRNVETTTQTELNHVLRTDPARVLGSAPQTGDILYSGLLHEGSALVFGVGRSDFVNFSEALKQSCTVVRQQTGVLALMNILLADPRVKAGEMTPVVADQGYAVVVTAGPTGWESVQGRRFVGGSTDKSSITELAQQVLTSSALPLLLAASPCNGGVDVAEALRAGGATVQPYAHAGLTESQLFVYASSLL